MPSLSSCLPVFYISSLGLSLNSSPVFSSCLFNISIQLSSRHLKLTVDETKLLTNPAPNCSSHKHLISVNGSPFLPATWAKAVNESCWIPFSLTSTCSQLSNTASSIFRIYPGSNHFSPSQPVPLPKSLTVSYWMITVTDFPVPVPALQSVFHTAARVLLLEQKLVHDSPAANSAVASHFIQGKPKSFEWLTSPCVIQDHARLSDLVSLHSPFAHAVPATRASSLLFITAATFGSFALALLFAWNILSPGYPHAFSFTLFLSS